MDFNIRGFNLIQAPLFRAVGHIESIEWTKKYIAFVTSSMFMVELATKSSLKILLILNQRRQYYDRYFEY